MARERSLRARLLSAAILPAVALSVAYSIAVVAVGHLTEELILERVLASIADELAESWPDKPTGVLLRPGLRVWRNPSEIPPELGSVLEGLSPGVHELDDVDFEGERTEFFVAIRELPDSSHPLVVAQEAVLYEATESYGLMYWATGVGILISSLALGVSVRNCLQVFRALDRLEKLIDEERTEGEIEAGLAEFHEDEIGRIARRWYTARGRVFSMLARQERFARDASHELRTPLTVMRGAIELLESGSGGADERSTRPLQRMRLATDDMHRLIQAFLWLARDRPLVEHDDAVPLVDVAQRCIDELPLVFGGGGERIRLELEGNAEVQAPRAIVEIVVRNLVLNALGHSGEGQVLTRVSDELLTVRNQVCDRSPMDKGQGSFGFGLSIVTSLCERFGWGLDIDSNVNGMFAVSVAFSPESAAPQATGTRPHPAVHLGGAFLAPSS